MSQRSAKAAAVGSLALLSLALLSARPAQADVLFSSLPYDDSLVFRIDGPSASIGYNEFAAQFRVSQTATLDSIDLPLAHEGGHNNALTVTLFSSVNDNPGIALATESIPANTLTDLPALYTVNFGGSPLLTAGSAYFVDLTTTGSTDDGWNLAGTSVQPLTVGRNDPNGTFSTERNSAAFRVNGTPLASVPEPAYVQMSVLLLASGAIGLRYRQRTRRRAS